MPETWPEYAFFTPLSQNRLMCHTLAPPQSQYTPGIVLLPYAVIPKAPIRSVFFKIKSQKAVELQSYKRICQTQALQPSLSKEDYLKALANIKKHIQRGDVYELNFCQKFTARAELSNPVECFADLCSQLNMPYAMLLKQASKYLFCLSPELFLKKTKQTLISKPIKGTAARHTNLENDAQAISRLLNSEKERAEHVMAVDVARHDLSRVAVRNSVHVPTLFGIETFTNVHQMVSTVKAELKPDVAWDSLMEATFPMASMTGAPKLKAIELIHQYEGFNRDWYSGALGQTEASGDFELAVVIRSFYYDAQARQIEICAGGAITHYSDPEQEYEECLLKIRKLAGLLGWEV